MPVFAPQRPAFLFMKITSSTVKEFKEWLKVMEFSPYTISTYVKVANILLLEKRIREINCYEFFQKFKEKMIKENKPPSTIKLYGMAVKKFLLFLFERYHCRIIELTHIKYKNQKQKPVSYLTLEEIEMIRNAKTGSPLWAEKRTKAMFEFILYTGCRASEVSNVKLNDIDIRTGELSILGKGNKERKVYTRGSEEIINDYLKSRLKNSEYLFSNKYGNKMRYKQVHKHLVALGKAAEIQKVLAPHLIRRTCITYMVMTGTDPKTVQMYAGHDSIETTFRHYVGVDEERMRKAHQDLEEIIKMKNRELIMVRP